jgi:hypothetical protein
MAIQPTIVSFLGDGATTLFAFPFDYISTDYVKVRVDGSDVSFSFTAAKSVQLSSAPANGTTIVISRETDRETLVDFVDGSVLLEDDLDLVNLQLLHIAQEAFDLASTNLTLTAGGALSASGRRLTAIGTPTSDADAVTKAWADAQMGASEAAAAASAATATTKASEAAASATAAATAANNAAASVTTSLTNAVAASAATATTKASEASVSAAEAAASAALLTYASNAEALSGTSNSRIMSPLRVREKMTEQGRLGRGYTLFTAVDYSFIWDAGDPPVVQQIVPSPLVATPSEASGVELIVSAKAYLRAQQTGTDDDVSALSEIQYKDAAGVWQDAPHQSAEGKFGYINGIAPGEYVDATMPMLTRLNSTHQNSSGEWEIRLVAKANNDTTSGHQMTITAYHAAIYAQEIYGSPL